MAQFLLTHPITVTSALIFALALAKGGEAERWGAAVMAAEWMIEAITDATLRSGPIATAPTIALDAGLALALLLLALRYGRLWLGAAMILQSVILALHAVRLSDDAPGYEFYATALNLLTCAVMLNLLNAVLTAWRRRARARRAEAPVTARLQPSA